jgi:hypothetical protein
MEVTKEAIFGDGHETRRLNELPFMYRLKTAIRLIFAAFK